MSTIDRSSGEAVRDKSERESPVEDARTEDARTEDARTEDIRTEDIRTEDIRTEDTQPEDSTETVVDRGRVRLPIQAGFPHSERVTRRGPEEDGVLVLNLESTDDLTTIRGIGPAFAVVLGEIGIRSYQQLASIDSSTLAALRTRLGPLAGRIERDRWIESAAAASRAKLNERRQDAVSM